MENKLYVVNYFGNVFIGNVTDEDCDTGDVRIRVIKKIRDSGGPGNWIFLRLSDELVLGGFSGINTYEQIKSKLANILYGELNE